MFEVGKLLEYIRTSIDAGTIVGSGMCAGEIAWRFAEDELGS